VKHTTLTYYLSYALSLLMLLFLCTEPIAAQNVPGRIKNRVKNAARQKVNERVSAVKSTGRMQVNTSKRALKNSLKGGKPGIKPGSDATLDELIDDKETRASLTDNTNKSRYVELFGEWTTMPSDAELLARAKLKAIQDSLNNIDRKYFRVTKNIWDDSRPMIIFGWHPYWLGDIYKGYDYDMFNVVSYYSYDINPETGSPQNSAAMSSFMQGEFVSTAHNKGCSALLSVSCHGEQNVTRFLNQNISAQQRFMDSILFILDSTNADGIEINFEGVIPDVKDDFFKFVRILSTTLTGARGDTSFVFLSVPAYDPDNIYDVAKLQDFVDIFVVKGFDFQETPEGLKKMPTAPFNYSALTTAPDLRTAVDKYIADLGPIYSARLVLALPYYGTRWVTDGITEEILDMQAITYNDIQFEFVMQIDDYRKYPGARLKYDSVNTSYVFSYYDYYGIDTLLGDIPADVTIYFDDSLSLQKKYRYLMDSRLGGVGVQFLGNDAGFDHLRQLLSDEFMEIIEPKNEKLVELTKKSNAFRQNSIYVLAVLLYLAIFMAIGLCAALFNRQVRQALFDKGQFRIGYMLFFTFLMLLVGGYMGLFEGTTMPLLVGVIFGAIISWIGWKYVSQKKSLTP